MFVVQSSPSRLGKPSVNRSPDLMSGELAGRYTIERELGRGATSVVFLARDVAHGRAVAVKVLRDELISEINTERFLREVRITAQLEHPNIVPLLDSGEVDGRPFFVLSYMSAGSLRDRLQRDKQLPIAEVVALGTMIARALQFAHDRNLLHRDVKPENILFSEGRACLADFGIARALGPLKSESTTSTGVVRGTPAYFSPEQAAGDRDIDGRSDIYSLACVLYEALAGVPAFVGPTPQSIVAQRLSHVPRGVRVYRPTVPEELEQVLEHALAVAPVDRFQTAAEFADALEAAPTTSFGETRTGYSSRGAVRAGRRRRRALLVVPGIALALALAWGTTRAPGSRESRLMGLLEGVGVVAAELDTTTIAVVPADSTALPDAADALQTRLSRWDELTVVERSVVADAARSALKASVGDRAHRIAVAVRAGRYVRVRTARVRDTVEVTAALFDTRTDARLVEKTARLANPAAAADLLDALADSVLFRGDVARMPRPQGKGGTTSLRARRAFLRGQAALEEGDFVRADSAFFSATRIDPDDAQSLIWLANVRSWMRNWGEHSWGQLTRQAAQAVARRGSVAVADSVLLTALVALDARRWDEACPRWSWLAKQNAFDFAAWYGLGNCLGRDPAVLRDPASASNWRFRSSYEQAVRAYEQAFRLRPSMLRGFGGRSLGDLEDLFFIRGTRTREGVAIAPDTGDFEAAPLWQHDSLAFVPLRTRTAMRGPWPEAQILAVQHERERFHSITQMWRAEAPASVEAAEALAVSLELLGDAAALDTVRLARALAREPNDRLRIAASEVLLRVKFSLPSDSLSLRAARSLADSLLQAHPPSERAEPQLLASLAGLTGRASLAASYAIASGANEHVPSVIAQSGPALLAFAALGGPCDTLKNLEEIVETNVAALPESGRSPIRARWLMRAAALAFPDCRLRTLATAAHTASHRDAQTDLLSALSSDADGMRRGLGVVARARASFRPADIRMEGLLPGAAAFASIGDTERAIEWLDPTLRVLRLSASQNLANVVQTGSLVRAMALRAKLAEDVGDTATARGWARAVVTLWSGADSYLQPTVRDMARLAR